MSKAWTKLSLGQVGFIGLILICLWQILQEVMEVGSQAIIGDYVGAWAETIGWIFLLAIIVVIYLMTRNPK